MKKLEKNRTKKTKRVSPNINVRSTPELVAKFKTVCEAYSMTQREFIERSVNSAYTMVVDQMSECTNKSCAKYNIDADYCCILFFLPALQCMQKSLSSNGSSVNVLPVEIPTTL